MDRSRIQKLGLNLKNNKKLFIFKNYNISIVDVYVKLIIMGIKDNK